MRSIVISLLTLALVLLPLGFSCAESAAGSGSSEMTLLAINVRKADALLLRCGSSAYLIDTGTEESYSALYAALRGEGISRLTGVIVTHTDSDHSGGLKQLIASDIEVENVYASAFYKKKNVSKHPVVKALKGTDLEAVFLSSGDSLPLDGGRLSVIGPLEKNEDKENNNSLVLLAEGGGGSILLTGDMEFPEENSLLTAGLLPHADVIKIGNHGEDDATSTALINAVRPSLAVISTNTDDEPDTPSPRVLRTLASFNVPVLVTQDTEIGVLVTIRGGEILTEMK